MRSPIVPLACFFALALAPFAVSQEDVRVLPPLPGAELLQPGKDKQGGKDKKVPEKKKDVPAIDFTAAPTARSELATGYNPNMMGDIFGYFARITVTAPQSITTTTTRLVRNVSPGLPPRLITTTTTRVVPETRTLLIPAAAHGAFKVAENASPVPVDRVFFTYNFYGDIRGPNNGSTGPLTINQTSTMPVPGGASITNSTVTFPGAPYINLHREVIGFEKTFLDGYASIEMRLPILQTPSSLVGFQADGIGDLTIIGKYAFYLDRTTGDVISGGLAVTAPTGQGIPTADGTIRDTVLQPWGGYVWNRGNSYLLGFHSIAVPTDDRDVTLLFNDVGVGYWLYRGDPAGTLNFIVPNAEVHVTTPLNHRTNQGPIYAPDMVVLTGGAHIGLFRNAVLSIGAATPITGPRVYAVEAFAQFNWRF
jgi:hypothetical protein